MNLGMGLGLNKHRFVGGGGNTDAFIIEVDTSKAGSNSDQFQFTGAQGNYDVVAKQNGIVVQTFRDLSGEETITFNNGSGVYILEVKAKRVNGFNRIEFNNRGDKLKITDIKQWGGILWSTFSQAFFDCENMEVNAIDIPNLGICTSMDFMFLFATNANPNMRNWNINNINSMDSMLEGANLSVENLTACYENWSQLSLKQNISFHAGTTKYNSSGQVGRDILINTYNWSIIDGGLIPTLTIQIDSTKNGTSNNNQFQFTGAEGDYDILAKQGGNVIETFNNLSDEATITFTNAGVYDLHIFPKAVNGFSRIKFNNSGDDEKVKDIKQWGNIVWSSFEGAFFGCKNMLVTATDIPNLSQVTSMDCMFRGGSLANPDTTNWNTSNVTSMYAVFTSAFQFNKPLNNWDVSNVTNIRAMFLNAFAFNQPLNNWNTSNATQMEETFLSAKLFNQNINNWDVSGVENMTTMFYNAQAFNQPLNNWDVSNITTMHMFLEQSNMSAQNLADCYRDWSRLSLQQDVPFSAGTIKYNSSGQSGRNVLINTYNWSITDGGQA